MSLERKEVPIPYNLELSIIKGNLEFIKQVPKETLQEIGPKMLWISTQYNQFEISKYLVEACNIDVKQLNRKGKSSFVLTNSLLVSLLDAMTLEKFNNSDLLAHFDFLIQQGVDPLQNDTTILDWKDNTPLHSACFWDEFDKDKVLHTQQQNIIKKLIEMKVDIKDVIGDSQHTGCTALMLAAERGNTEVCKILITAGADLAQASSEYNCKRTAIAEAIYKGKKQCALELIDVAEKMAAENKCDLTLALQPALRYAIQLFDVDLIKSLIKNKVDVNSLDCVSSHTYLHMVVGKIKYMNAENKEVTNERLREILTILLEADVNAYVKCPVVLHSDDPGQTRTPLEFAKATLDDLDLEDGNEVALAKKQLLECFILFMEKLWPEYQQQKKVAITESLPLFGIFSSSLVRLVEGYSITEIPIPEAKPEELVHLKS